MAHNSNQARKRGQQPLFEIVLAEGCSIIYDEVPVNCTIRVIPVDGRSPPRMSPVSSLVEDYSSGGPSGGNNWSPPLRDKHDKAIIGSPITAPMRSRRSIVESMRRNFQENTGATSSEDIHKGFGGAEYDIFAFRKPYRKSESERPSTTSSSASTSSSTTTTSYRPSSPPPTEQSASTDRLLNSNRPQMDFRRTNIHVDATDLREMHSNLGPAPQQIFFPAEQPAKPTNERPQSASTSSSLTSSLPSPPSPSRDGRCCGMAEYSPVDYKSKTPERDRSKTGAISVPSTGGGTCTHHGILPCPTRASSRCRENRSGQSSGSATGSSSLQGRRSCKYHNALPCPVLAGVPCRGEIQKSGASTPFPSRPPSPDKEPPRFPDADVRSQRLPGGSTGLAYPPRTTSPPSKSPRSGTPSRRALQKCKGVCL